MAAMHRVPDCVTDSVWFGVPQAAKWQRIRNQIDAAMIFARSDFVNVNGMRSELVTAIG
jgi:hypothetical protein